MAIKMGTPKPKTLDTNLTIQNATFVDSFSVVNEENGPTSLHFNSNGTKVFIVGTGSTDVLQYNLSTAYDISTATYSGLSFDISNQTLNPVGLTFNPTGLKMYVTAVVTDAIFEYTLTTGFDITTASYTNNSFSFASQDGNPREAIFNDDGTKLFMIGLNTNSLYEYSLTTAYDISTASYTGTSFSVSSQQGSSRGFNFNSIGTKLFVVGASPDSAHEYDLSTGFDISTAVYTGISFAIADSGPGGIVFKPDGTKAFIVGQGGDSIYEYDL
jgi:hypothetical protein